MYHLNAKSSSLELSSFQFFLSFSPYYILYSLGQFQIDRLTQTRGFSAPFSLFFYSNKRGLKNKKKEEEDMLI